jgi:hypothetical protein
MKFILICATGRSGSTTMQRIVHSLPNSNICGENFGAVNDLLKFYNNIKKSCENNIPGGYTPISYIDCIEQNIKPCWYNCFNFDEIKTKLQELIIALFMPNNSNIIKTSAVIGFKELRWDLNLLDTFIELFPNTKVLIHIRMNIEEQSKSGWWKDDESALKILKNQNKKYINFYNKNKNRTNNINKKIFYLSTFENMFLEDKIIELFTFLEENVNLEEYYSIINNNIKD